MSKYFLHLLLRHSGRLLPAGLEAQIEFHSETGTTKQEPEVRKQMEYHGKMQRFEHNRLYIYSKFKGPGSVAQISHHDTKHGNGYISKDNMQRNRC